MTPNDVITEARRLLQDTTATYRYSDATMLGFVNQALKRTAYIRPDLFTIIGNVSLTHSTVVQSLPAGAIRLVEIYSVVGGTAVTEVNREMLDQSVPTWTSAAPGATVNYVRHIRNPTKFFVYPPPPIGLQVVAEYATTPTTYASTGDVITELPDVYLPSLVDCVVFLAESIDDEHVLSGRAKLFLDSFQQSLALTLTARPITDTEDAGLIANPGYLRPERQVI